jgi:hypothetical protein
MSAWQWSARQFRYPINWLRLAYFAVVAGLVIFLWSFWTPDLIFLVLLAGFALWGQAKQFLIKFAPFIILLLSYDSLRGLATYVNHHVHYTFMAQFDERLFGVLPTAWLQQLLYHGQLMWYDFYFYFLYMMHFIAPVAVAILLWKKRPQGYWRFITALLVLSYGAFITYVLYPASPPWMASELGFIQPIHRISSDVWWAMGVHNFPSIYHSFVPNDVAAVPSLHAAYPTLVWLFVYRYFDHRLAWPLLVYPLSVWLGVVYLGEHYFFDVLLGVIYALAAYGATELIFRWWARRGYSWRGLWARLRRPAVA